MRIRYLFSIIVIITILSCDKEAVDRYEKEQRDALRSLESTRFTCKGGDSNYYFKGKINDDSICY
jgi:hypothetical protein